MILDQALPNAFVLILFVSLACCTPLVLNENLELELVQVLFRHGARTQDSCEADVLKINETSLRPWGFGQLTREGMKQEYELGQMLRERYDGFLPALYNQKDVYASSSSPARTKVSLELVLSALYPPVEDFVWNPKLNWMPIPIHSIPEQLDILNHPQLCPKFGDLLIELYNSTELKNQASKHDDIRVMMGNIYGRPFDLNYIFCAYMSVFVQINRNLSLPEWYSDEVFQKLHDATSFHLDTLSYNAELKRLNGGPYVRRLLENMKESSASGGQKIRLHSSHDENLHAVASFHNITLPRIPDYGSAIILEMLRNKQKSRFVRFLFWSGNPKEFKILKLDNCAETCPLEEYTKIITPMLPSDDDMLCLLKNLQPKHLETILNSN